MSETFLRSGSGAETLKFSERKFLECLDPGVAAFLFSPSPAVPGPQVALKLEINRRVELTTWIKGVGTVRARCGRRVLRIVHRVSAGAAQHRLRRGQGHAAEGMVGQFVVAGMARPELTTGGAAVAHHVAQPPVVGATALLIDVKALDLQGFCRKLNPWRRLASAGLNPCTASEEREAITGFSSRLIWTHCLRHLQKCQPNPARGTRQAPPRTPAGIPPHPFLLTCT